MCLSAPVTARMGSEERSVASGLGGLSQSPSSSLAGASRPVLHDPLWTCPSFLSSVRQH